MLHFGDLFGAFIVIVVKNRQDVLTGFNKLDSLIKVSIFQKYKDKMNEVKNSGTNLNTLLNDRITRKNLDEAVNQSL